MELKVLQNEMVAALKARNKFRKDVISSLVGAVKKAAIDKNCRDNVTEELVNAVLIKEQKTMQEMIDTCPADRTDLLESYQRRYDVMNEFAPKMLSAEEVKEIISSKYADVIATGNKGQIMKTVMPEFKGKADGKIVQQVVAELM